MTKEDIDRIVLEYFDDKESEHEMDEVFDLAKKVLEKQMPQPKTGHWIFGGYDDNYYICDRCNYKASEYYSKPYYNYCPNCGAKMEGSDADSN